MNPRFAPTVAVPAVPPGFVRHFVEGGWREVERVYGCRTALMLAWMEMSGGLEELHEQRREYLRAQMLAARETVRGEHLGIALAAVSRRQKRA